MFEFEGISIFLPQEADVQANPCAQREPTRSDEATVLKLSKMFPALPVTGP